VRRLYPVGIVLLMMACGGKVEEDAPVIRPVRVEKVAMQGGQRTRVFSGTARSGLEAKLSFRVAGRIEELAVKLGDRVDKGQLIARLDDRDYRLQVDDTEAGLRNAEAKSRNAIANYERIRDLYEHNSVSINDLDAARAAMESAQAQVESIRKRLELVQSQLAYTRLTAPLEGSIAQTAAEVNENVAAGQVIAILNAGTRPEAIFSLPEQLIGGITEGDAVEVQFDAISDQSFAATITEVGVAAGALATTYPVVARLDEPNDQVRQGMVADISVVFGRAGDPKRMMVKSKAVVEDSGGRFVYVAVPSGDGMAVVERRDVQTGSLTSSGLEVISGLQDGERVIVAGIRFLHEGMTVKLPRDEE